MYDRRSTRQSPAVTRRLNRKCDRAATLLREVVGPASYRDHVVDHVARGKA
jgi:hypothetical protein